MSDQPDQPSNRDVELALTANANAIAQSAAQHTQDLNKQKECNQSAGIRRIRLLIIYF